jgi:hypothetical protein
MWVMVKTVGAHHERRLHIQHGDRDVSKTSIVLGKFIAASIAASSCLVVNDAFATCGWHCENPILDRVDVIGGWYNPWDVSNPCDGGCDWEWDPPSDYNDGGGNDVTIIPLEEVPVPDWDEPFDGRCATSIRSVPFAQGGGHIRFRLCWESGDFRVVECTDHPTWGVWGNACLIE